MIAIILIVASFVTFIIKSGFLIVLYTVIAFASFAFGLLLFLPDTRWNVPNDLRKIDLGLVPTTEPKSKYKQKRSVSPITDFSKLDTVLYEIIDCIVNDYILDWYKSYAYDSDFPLRLRYSLARFIRSIVHLAKDVDWIPFITEEIPNIFVDHLRIYRGVLSLNQHPSDTECVQLFFNIESTLEKYYCREGISTCLEFEAKHLRKFADTIIFISLTNDYNNPALRYLMRELLLNGILLPTINILSDPDLVNQTIIFQLNEIACTSDYFIQSLKMSTIEDELQAVEDLLIKFSHKLRGRDAGGDDDAIVKAQLSSLEYVKRICSKRIELTKAGIAVKIENAAEDKTHHFNLSFDDVISNNVAATNFLEFLTSTNHQSLFTLYLNCMAYRINAEELISEDNSSLASSSICGENGDLASSHSTNNNYNNLSDHAVEFDVRAFGISMCSLVLQNLPQVKDDIVHRVLKKLTIETGNPDPLVFSEIEDQLVNILSDEKCFGAFKRTHYYYQTLFELGLTEDLFDPRSVPDDPRSSTNSVRVGHHKRGASDGFFLDSSLSDSSHLVEAVFSASHMKMTSQTSQPAKSVVSTVMGPLADIYTAKILSFEMMFENFIVYSILVSSISPMTGETVRWKIQRRFSDFDKLHSVINEKCGRINQIKLPPKKAFSSTNREFIFKRRRDLDDYLQIICNPELHAMHPSLRKIVLNFLSHENWEKNKSTGGGMASIVNPLKTVGNAMLSVQDTLFDGFSKMLSKRETNSVNMTSFTSGLDQLDTDNIPIRILFRLVDEMFDLQKKTQIFRRGILNILRRLTKALFGDTVNRMVTQMAEKLISSKQMTIYATMLRDYLWPDGPSILWMNTERSVPPKQRDNATKLRTRVLCRTLILGSVAEELAQYLGIETTRSGVQRLFNLLQHPVLNRRLVHCFLEGFLRQLLGEYAGKLDEICCLDNCPLNSARTCSLHTSVL